MFEHFYNGEMGNKMDTMEPVLNSFLTGKSALILAHGETGKRKYND